MATDGEYCAFTKALEHLGDRWSLLIVRDLMISGSLGFNALASGLPGVSRSVLANRLRHLTDLGVVDRSSTSTGEARGYRLTPGGQQLGPVVMALRTWAERWVPEDPGMLRRDPDVVMAWLVLGLGRPPSICVDDPGLTEDRYVFVESDVTPLAAVAQGTRDWVDAVRQGDIRLFGAPELIRALPDWFRPAGVTRSRPPPSRTRTSAPGMKPTSG